MFEKPSSCHQYQITVYKTGTQRPHRQKVNLFRALHNRRQLLNRERPLLEEDKSWCMCLCLQSVLWRCSGLLLFISVYLVRGELIKKCLQVAHAGFYRSERRQEGESHTQQEEGATVSSHRMTQIYQSAARQSKEPQFLGVHGGKVMRQLKRTERGKKSTKRERDTTQSVQSFRLPLFGA